MENEVILDTPVDDVVLDPMTGNDIPPVDDSGKFPTEVPVGDPIDVTEPDGALCPEGECTTHNITIGEFFGTLQESVTISWRMHLKTRKHHIHVALNEYYNGVLYRVDQIIEHYQGIYGIIEQPFVNYVYGEGKSEVEYLQELKHFIENNRYTLFTESELQSDLDEILGLIDSTMYKISSFCEGTVKSFEAFVYENYCEECDDNEEEE